LCFNIFDPVYDQEQAAATYKRGEDVCTGTSVITSKPMSLNDLPDVILLHILSYFGPEDLCLIIAKVCERWNVLAKDKVLWKKLSYSCDRSSDISHIKKVRCTALLRFTANQLANFALSNVLNYKILKSISEIGPFSILSELRQVSKGLH
jgi:hypothetical protein